MNRQRAVPPSALEAVHPERVARGPTHHDADAFPYTSIISLTVAAVTFANGGDNIGVYVPVFLAVGTGALVAYCVVFLALVAVEVTDIIFAIDSVPAIYALTSEPLIVFMSNIMAILGLRAMYFLLAGTMDLFHLLKYSLAAILVFVGLKMVWLNEAFGGKFPIGFSLLIIASLLAVGVAASLMVRKKPDASG